MGLSLYIHYPFCRNICSYCDFYKENYDLKLEEEYFKALKTELDISVTSIESEKRILDSIYIGGGTPSLAGIGLLSDFLEDLKNRFFVKPAIEFSFEINPESIDVGKLISLQTLGVNRPIFGIQSFSTSLLKTLNRKHDLYDSFYAVYLARALGFNNFGVDMIFGLPRQTSRKLSDDLNQLVELAPPHISYYQLTVEKRTILERKISENKLRLPDDDSMAAMYRAINQELSKFGYIRYEISSYAMPGHECRHNLRYWQGGDYLGLGPSAHSFIGDRRFANIDKLNTYITTLKEGKKPLIFDSDDKNARVNEAIMLGLRTADGLDKKSFLIRFRKSFEEAVNYDNFLVMIDKKLIKSDDKSISLTETGIPVADEIISHLIK